MLCVFAIVSGIDCMCAKVLDTAVKSTGCGKASSVLVKAIIQGLRLASLLPHEVFDK